MVRVAVLEVRVAVLECGEMGRAVLDQLGVRDLGVGTLVGLRFEWECPSANHSLTQSINH